MPSPGLFPLIIRAFFLLAACGIIADVADPDSAYESPDAALIQRQIITRASGNLFRAPLPPCALRCHTATSDDGTDDTPKVAFSPITGANPGVKTDPLAIRFSAYRQEPQAVRVPLFAFRRDRAHRIRDGGDLSDGPDSPIAGQTALPTQGGLCCPWRSA